MLLLAPLALLWILLWGGLGDWPGIGTVSLLALGGPVTAIPLTLFAFAARRLPFATIGLLQFVAPTMIFLQDRKSVVSGKSVSVRVDLGGRRHFKKKTNKKH